MFDPKLADERTSIAFKGKALVAIRPASAPWNASACYCHCCCGIQVGQRSPIQNLSKHLFHDSPQYAADPAVDPAPCTLKVEAEARRAARRRALQDYELIVSLVAQNLEQRPTSHQVLQPRIMQTHQKKRKTQKPNTENF